MARYRDALPQLGGGLFLTDGGMETTLIFHEGQELPHFAAFVLQEHETGREILRRYFHTYADIARRHAVGLVLETATWRANSDWGERLGYAPAALAAANRDAVAMLSEVRGELETETTPMIVSGCLGPRGDAYNPATIMTAEEAQRYHAAQTETFAASDADMLSAMTLGYPAEAAGMARAAHAAGMPLIVSFTVETDGRLPSGHSLREAIDQVDNSAETPPAYYMINCAHPTHFADSLTPGKPWLERIRGLRANASARSHAELDAAADLDDGDPNELATQYRKLRARLTAMSVLGGCCGTDHRHVEAICQACAPLF